MDSLAKSWRQGLVARVRITGLKNVEVASGRRSIATYQRKTYLIARRRVVF